MKNPYAVKAKIDEQEEIIRYLPLVKKIANRLMARLPDTVEVQDLIQIGVVGLMTAIKAF